MATDCHRVLTALGLLLVSLHASQALQWTSEIQNGDRFHRCTGDNFTLPWSYVTENDENVIVLFWFSNENGSFASYFADKFTTSSDRVTYAGNAGITLSDVSKNDDDTYGVSMRLYGRGEPVIQYATLSVAEPPRTTNGEIRVIQKFQDSLNTGNTSYVHMRLKCGQFLSLGTPPVSVMWKDPSGHSRSSSFSADGFYYLDVPPYAKGGNYTCFLDPDDEATKCLHSSSPLLDAASFYVETMETVVTEQKEELKSLKAKMLELREGIRGHSVTADLGQMQELEERVDNLEAMSDNLTRELESQKVAEDAQEKAHQGSLAQLQTSLQDAVKGLQEKTQQNVEAGMDKLNHQLDVLSNDLSLQQAACTQNGISIESLLHRLDHLEKANERQVITNGNLQRSVADLQQISENQNNKISSLQQQVAALQKENADLRSSAETVSWKLEHLQTAQRESLRELTEKLGSLELGQDNLTDVLRNETQGLRSLIAQQEFSLVDFEQDYQVMSETIEDFRNTMGEMTHDVQELTGRFQDEQHTRSDEATQIQAQLRQMAVSQQESLGELHNKTESLQLGQDNLMDVLQTETRTLRGLLEEQGKTMEDTSDHFESLYKDVSSAVQDVRNTTANQDDLHNLSQRLEDEERTRADSHTQLQTRMVGLVETLTQHMSESRTKKAAFDSQLISFQQNFTSIMSSQEAALARIESVEEQLERVQQSVKENITQVPQTGTGGAELATLQENVRSLHAASSQRDTTLATLQTQFGEFKALTTKFHPIRLVGGTNSREGRVEILVGHQWGAVCDDGWDNNDAAVICGMLGYRRSGALATVRATHGQGAGPIVLDDVACTGNELDIRLCPATEFGTNNCNHGEDAGVICQP